MENGALMEKFFSGGLYAAAGAVFDGDRDRVQGESCITRAQHAAPLPEIYQPFDALLKKVGQSMPAFGAT
jgi:hypothetical protein